MDPTNQIENILLKDILVKGVKDSISKDMVSIGDFEKSIGLLVHMVNENNDVINKKIDDSRIDEQSIVTEIKKNNSDIVSTLRDGEDGYTPLKGIDYVDGEDGYTPVKGKDYFDGMNGKDGSPDTPDQIIEKVNTSSLIIKKERVEGLVDTIRIAVSNANSSALPVTTSFFNGLRGKNLVIVGATVYQQGDTVYATPTGGGTSSPLTTKGDLYTYSTTNARLPVGTDGQILSADSTTSTGLKWIANSGGTTFYDNEVVSGSGTSFQLAHAQVTNSQHIYGGSGTSGGLARLIPSVDYTIDSLGAITIISGTYPAGGILADYRLGTTVTVSDLLLEDGFKLLMEDGSNFQLE